MIPAWVVKNLKEYGNCALPNAYTNKNRAKLIEKLEKATGEKISIRECKYNHKEDYKFGSLNRKPIQHTTIYLVAEVKR